MTSPLKIKAGADKLFYNGVNTSFIMAIHTNTTTITV